MLDVVVVGAGDGILVEAITGWTLLVLAAAPGDILVTRTEDLPLDGSTRVFGLHSVPEEGRFVTVAGGSRTPAAAACCCFFFCLFCCFLVIV